MTPFNSKLWVNKSCDLHTSGCMRGNGPELQVSKQRASWSYNQQANRDSSGDSTAHREDVCSRRSRFAWYLKKSREVSNGPYSLPASSTIGPGTTPSAVSRSQPILGK